MGVSSSAPQARVRSVRLRRPPITRLRRLNAGVRPHYRGRIVCSKLRFSKIAHGLLVGLGFGAAVAGAMYGYSKWQMHELEQGDMFGGMFKEYTADAGLTIKTHRPQLPQENSAFLGVISNSGKDTW